MHDNPVRLGIVNSPGEVEYSSHNYYYGKAVNYLVDIPE
jgi:hypothetical protein